MPSSITVVWDLQKLLSDSRQVAVSQIVSFVAVLHMSCKIKKLIKKNTHTKKGKAHIYAPVKEHGSLML